MRASNRPRIITPLHRGWRPRISILRSRAGTTGCRTCHYIWLWTTAFFAYGAALLAVDAFAQTSETMPPPSALKKLSVEELMDIEVTSVSKRPEKLSETASAIQVITQEDIRRSGASSLPEALRLASNLEVAQIDSSQWAISARGFNSTAANKLLVMIDGRTVYTRCTRASFGTCRIRFWKTLIGLK